MRTTRHKPRSRLLSTLAAATACVACLGTLAPSHDAAADSQALADVRKGLTFDEAGRDEEVKAFLGGDLEGKTLDLSKTEDVFKLADGQAALAKFNESNATLETLTARGAPPDGYYWRQSRNYFLIGEYLPLTDKKGRMKAYNAQIRAAEECLTKYPNSPDCRLFRALGKGRRATTMGLVRAFLRGKFHPKEFIEEVEKVIAAKPAYVAPGKVYSTLGNAYILASIFYRTAPRGFFAKMLIGVEGDTEKSADYGSRAVKELPNALIYRKEFGIALMCYGTEKSVNKAVERAKKELTKTTQLRARSWLDRLDQEHAKLFATRPDLQKLACKYNRDGFQDPEADYKKEKGDEAPQPK